MEIKIDQTNSINALNVLKSSKLTYIMYHYVRDYQKTAFPKIRGLDVKEFENQLHFLVKHYNCISMEDALEFYNEKLALPPKALILTFDDGYIDHYEYVLPILKKFSLKGAFYVPIQSFEQKTILDVNKIHIVLAIYEDKTQLLSSVLSKLKEFSFLHKNLLIPSELELREKSKGQGNRYDTSDVLLIKQILQKWIPREAARYILEQLIHSKIGLDNDLLYSKMYMNERHLREMLTEGMHIGAHSFAHEWLDNLTPTELDNDFSACVNFLTKLNIPKNQWTFSYPYGGFNELVMRKVQDWGFQAALTTDVNIATHDLRYCAPRLDTNDFPKQRDADLPSWYFKA